MRKLTHVVAVAALVLATSSLRAQGTVSPGDTPAWLQQRIAAFASQPDRAWPIEIWQLTHRGRAAYFEISPCCDQYNPLFDAQGKQLCSPNGGIVGEGDGRCPFPADAGTPILRVWRNPALSPKEPRPPRLSRP